nr:terminase family protein [uncultured Sphingobacterium sp.]
MNNINIQLPTPHPAQKQILQAYYKGVKNITINAGRRFGKSNLMKSIALLEAINNKKIGYITPQYSLAKVFFKEVCDLIPESIATINKSDLTIFFFNGGEIRFFTGDGDSLDGNMRGLSFDLIIIDETAFIPNIKEKIEGAISATLADRDGRMLMISTPLGKNYWFEICQLNDGVLYQHFHFTSYSNPYLKKSVIDRFKEQLSTAQFNQEFLAIAGENASAIVDGEVIERNTITTLSTLPTVVFGIDVATSPNGDYTSITGLDTNGRMTSHRHHRGFDSNLLEGIIKDLPQNILKVIDKTGLGDGLFSRLQLLTQNIIGIHFDSTTKLNLITELRIAINTDKLKFNEITAKELSTYSAKLNPKTSNISFNALSGCFDDCVVSLSLANYYLKEGRVTQGGNYLNSFSW